MKKIIRVTWNWSPALMEGSGDTRIDVYTDTYEEANVGNENVLEINEHKPTGEGDKLFYDIHYENGDVVRVFNPNTVVFENAENKSHE